MTRCLLIQSKLPPIFWAMAVTTVNHIRNRCLSKSLHGEIPYEIWTGRWSSCDHMRNFGSTVFVLNKDPAKSKLADRSMRGIFVGYPRESKGYNIWLPETRKVIVARDLKFRENNFGYSEENIDPGDLIDNSVSECEEPKPSSTVHIDEEFSLNDSYEEPMEDNASELRGRGKPRILRTGSKGRPRKLFASSHEEEGPTLPTILVEDGDVFSGVAEIALHEAMISRDCN